MEGYRIPPVWFTESEANALITAEQFISKNKDASFVKVYSEAINKIKSVLRNNTEYESDHTKPYTTILGCRVENLNKIPDGMIGKSFEGGNYVKLSAKGDLMKGLIVNKWTEIWKMDLDRVFTADYEVYGEKAQNPADTEIDFLIAVK